MNYDVSDSLNQLNDALADFEMGGLQMDADAVVALRQRLRQLCDQAKVLEHEASKSMWNAQARREELQRTNAIIREASRPDSNLYLLPTRERPAFGGGDFGGDAA